MLSCKFSVDRYSGVMYLNVLTAAIRSSFCRERAAGGLFSAILLAQGSFSLIRLSRAGYQPAACLKQAFLLLQP